MKRVLYVFGLLVISFGLKAQIDTIPNQQQNTAQALMNSKPGLQIGGYGEVHYNQPLKSNTHNLGTLDAHRMVLFFGYNFSSKTQFVTEVEIEYAREVWVEQMFIQYKLNRYANFRAGVLLVPMGIINEYHEPTAFNGVERPIIDNRIAPTTWREVGLGFQGNVYQAKTRYQLYVVNGLNGYDGTNAMFSGSKGLREGRQKASKAYMNQPAFTGKLEFYGVRNLNVGLSGYFGKSNSKLYSNLSKDSLAKIQRADSSVVGISMVGLDTRYNFKGVKLTGQLYYISLSNTNEYNVFTKTVTKLNDLGSAMLGYYVEVGYDIFHMLADTKQSLMPFIRYEAYNTHHSVEEPVVTNKSYSNTIITTGLTYALEKGVVLKADLQFYKSKAENSFSKTFNAGIGVNF